MKQSASFLALITFSGQTLSGLAHTLSGQVTDASGKPVSDASVEIVGSQLQPHTDAQVRFNLDTVDGAPDEHHINAHGYSHKTLHLDKGQSESLSIGLRRSAIEQIDVTATPFHASIMESAQPVTVVAGDELQRKQAATLGAEKRGCASPLISGRWPAARLSAA